MIKKSNQIRRYPISGVLRLSNFVWTIVVFLGSMGFLIAGFSCYFNLFNYKNIQFFPQGFVMVFYGFLGLLFSLYLSLLLFWGVGSGFNEFNKQDSYIRIFRWGFPGKNRRIDLYYSWDDVLGLVIIDNIFLIVRGKNKIPLAQKFSTSEEMEKQASALAQFLQVSLIVISK